MRVLTRFLDPLAGRDDRLGRAAGIALEVHDRADEDRVAIVAAGLAFYVLVSLIPAVVATVAVYSLVRGPADLFLRIESWTTSFPDEVQRLVAGQLLEIAGMTGGRAGVSLLVSVLATFWAASKAARALMSTMNIAYGLDHDRHGAQRRGIAVAVVVAAIILAVMALALVDTGATTAGSWWSTATSVLFWPLVVLAQAACSALAYRFAPNRDGADVEPMLPGTILSSGVFVVASGALALYVATADIGRAYGALGAFVGGALWLLTISWGLLIGAYVNDVLDDGEAEDARTPSRVRGGSEG